MLGCSGVEANELLSVREQIRQIDAVGRVWAPGFSSSGVLIGLPVHKSASHKPASDVWECGCSCRTPPVRLLWEKAIRPGARVAIAVAKIARRGVRKKLRTLSDKLVNAGNVTRGGTGSWKTDLAVQLRKGPCVTQSHTSSLSSVLLSQSSLFAFHPFSSGVATSSA